MALVLYDRVQQTGTANTTVSFTLTGSVSGYQSFSVVGNGNTTYYGATDTSGNWEAGIGTYATGGTLTRTTILASSNSGSAVTFSDTVTVFVTYPAGKSVNLDASGNVGPLGTITSGVWNGTTIPVAYGGTGVTSSSGANSVMLRDANQNVSINRLNQSSTTVTAAGTTTTLTAASTFSQILNGTGGQTFKLPDATTLTNTTTFEFNNNATGTLTIVDNASGAVGTISSGGAAAIALLSNGTIAGTWDVHAYIPENVQWGTNSLALGSTVITGGTWNGGTIPTGYGGTGLTTFTSANNALYSTSGSALAAGTLPVAAGGTGMTTATTNGVFYGNGTSAHGVTAAGTTGQVLIATTGGAPSWGSVPTTAAVTSFQTSLSGLTPSTASTGVVTLAGTLGAASGGTGANTLTGYVYGNGTSAMTASTTIPTSALTGTLGIANGGTGQTTASAAFNALSPITTAGDLIIGNGANSATRLAIGTNGYILQSNGTTASWQPNAGSTTLTTTDFTATAGQTTFSVTYTPALLQGVYRNGVKLGLADYTATSGTSIVLATGAAAGDLIQVQYFSSLSTTTAVNSISFGSTGLTPSTATSGAVTVAGTLGIANGGTGQTSFTAGQIHYGSFSTSANLFWDSTNNRLGIGTSSPSYKLDVVGAARFSNSDNENIYLAGSTNTASIQQAGSALYFNSNTNTTSGGFIWRNSSSYTELMRLDSSGNVGIGTATASNLLTLGASGGPTQRFTDTTSGVFNLIQTGSNGDFTISADHGNTGASTNIIFKSDGATERMRLTSTGAVSFGSSGTATGTSGQVLTSAGSGAAPTWSTPATGAATWQSVQTTGFTAVAGNAYPCNTTSAGFTVTLPASPSAGNLITISDYAGTFATNNLTINPNGNKINGSTSNVTLNIDRQSMNYVYIDATQGWIAFAAIYAPTSFTVPISYVVVAGGGGGGGNGGGGGGGGGFRASTTTLVRGTTYTVTVGGGGAGGGSGGTTGSNSVLGSITSSGGGGGGTNSANGSAGGSGGGGGFPFYSLTTGGAGTSGQGTNGGNGGASTANLNAESGSGGGATGAGANGTNGGTTNGGAGTATSISGSSVTYAGGGGGTGDNRGSGGNGSGGAGGGGNGNKGGAGGTGGTNTGGGGGAGGSGVPSYNGGAGGSGIVIISVPTASYSGTYTGTATVTTNGTNTVITWTGSGSYTA